MFLYKITSYLLIISFFFSGVSVCPPKFSQQVTIGGAVSDSTYFFSPLQHKLVQQRAAFEAEQRKQKILELVFPLITQERLRTAYQYIVKSGISADVASEQLSIENFAFVSGFVMAMLDVHAGERPDGALFHRLCAETSVGKLDEFTIFAVGYVQGCAYQSAAEGTMLAIASVGLDIDKAFVKGLSDSEEGRDTLPFVVALDGDTKYVDLKALAYRSGMSYVQMTQRSEETFFEKSLEEFSRSKMSEYQELARQELAKVYEGPLADRGRRGAPSRRSGDGLSTRSRSSSVSSGSSEGCSAHQVATDDADDNKGFFTELVRQLNDSNDLKLDVLTTVQCGILTDLQRTFADLDQRRKIYDELGSDLFVDNAYKMGFMRAWHLVAGFGWGGYMHRAMREAILIKLYEFAVPVHRVYTNALGLCLQEAEPVVQFSAGFLSGLAYCVAAEETVLVLNVHSNLRVQFASGRSSVGKLEDVKEFEKDIVTELGDGSRRINLDIVAYLDGLGAAKDSIGSLNPDQLFRPEWIKAKIDSVTLLLVPGGRGLKLADNAARCALMDDDFDVVFEDDEFEGILAFKEVIVSQSLTAVAEETDGSGDESDRLPSPRAGTAVAETQKPVSKSEKKRARKKKKAVRDKVVSVVQSLPETVSTSGASLLANAAVVAAETPAAMAHVETSAQEVPVSESASQVSSRASSRSAQKFSKQALKRQRAAARLKAVADAKDRNLEVLNGYLFDGPFDEEKPYLAGVNKANSFADGKKKEELEEALVFASDLSRRSWPDMAQIYLEGFKNRLAELIIPLQTVVLRPSLGDSNALLPVASTVVESSSVESLPQKPSALPHVPHGKDKSTKKVISTSVSMKAVPAKEAVAAPQVKPSVGTNVHPAVVAASKAAVPPLVSGSSAKPVASRSRSVPSLVPTPSQRSTSQSSAPSGRVIDAPLGAPPPSLFHVLDPWSCGESAYQIGVTYGRSEMNALIKSRHQEYASALEQKNAEFLQVFSASLDRASDLRKQVVLSPEEPNKRIAINKFEKGVKKGIEIESEKTAQKFAEGKAFALSGERLKNKNNGLTVSDKSVGFGLKNYFDVPEASTRMYFYKRGYLAGRAEIYASKTVQALPPSFRTIQPPLPTTPPIADRAPGLLITPQGSAARVADTSKGTSGAGAGSSTDVPSLATHQFFVAAGRAIGAPQPSVSGANVTELKAAPVVDKAPKSLTTPQDSVSKKDETYAGAAGAGAGLSTGVSSLAVPVSSEKTMEGSLGSNRSSGAGAGSSVARSSWSPINEYYENEPWVHSTSKQARSKGFLYGTQCMRLAICDKNHEIMPMLQEKQGSLKEATQLMLNWFDALAEPLRRASDVRAARKDFNYQKHGACVSAFESGVEDGLEEVKKSLERHFADGFCKGVYGGPLESSSGERLSLEDIKVLIGKWSEKKLFSSMHLHFRNLGYLAGHAGVGSSATPFDLFITSFGNAVPPQGTFLQPVSAVPVASVEQRLHALAGLKRVPLDNDISIQSTGALGMAPSGVSAGAANGLVVDEFVDSRDVPGRAVDERTARECVPRVQDEDVLRFSAARKLSAGLALQIEKYESGLQDVLKCSTSAEAQAVGIKFGRELMESLILPMLEKIASPLEIKEALRAAFRELFGMVEGPFKATFEKHMDTPSSDEKQLKRAFGEGVLKGLNEISLQWSDMFKSSYERGSEGGSLQDSSGVVAEPEKAAKAWVTDFCRRPDGKYLSSFFNTLGYLEGYHAFSVRQAAHAAMPVVSTVDVGVGVVGTSPSLKAATVETSVAVCVSVDPAAPVKPIEIIAEALVPIVVESNVVGEVATAADGLVVSGVNVAGDVPLSSAGDDHVSVVDVAPQTQEVQLPLPVDLGAAMAVADAGIVQALQSNPMEEHLSEAYKSGFVRGRSEGASKLWVDLSGFESHVFALDKDIISISEASTVSAAQRLSDLRFAEGVRDGFIAFKGELDQAYNSAYSFGYQTAGHYGDYNSSVYNCWYAEYARISGCSATLRTPENVLAIYQQSGLMQGYADFLAAQEEAREFALFKQFKTLQGMGYRFG